MINQFTSIRNSSAIYPNNSDDVDVEVDAKLANALDDGVAIGQQKTGSSASDMPNEFSDGETNECALKATMGPITTTKTEMKINFSVDRLLSKVDVDDGKMVNTNKLLRNGQKSVLTIDQLLSSSGRIDQQQSSKQIVRPMPMRYLQSTPAPAAVKSASTMYSVNGPQSIHMQHYYKYINSNASHFSPLQYPKQSQPSQPMPSVPNSPSVCSSGRYLDTYGTHKSSFASTENANTTLSAVSTVSPTGHVKRKRSWSRAVFSQLQRKGLEIQFQIQKYITKPDRRKLAARLGLTDAQVKVWFQNRRMKWRHTRETKLNADKQLKRPENGISDDATNATSEDDDADDLCSADGTSDEDEIDVVAE